MSEIRKMTEKEQRNLNMNVFGTESSYMNGPREICNALVNPHESEYDYFISFEPNALSFTEGIKGLLDAAKSRAFEGFMWAVKEINRQQQNLDLDGFQIWHISGFSGSAGTRLRGFNATVCDKEETFVMHDPRNVVVEKITYEDTIPEGVTVALWMNYSSGHNHLMLPSEYKNTERLGTAA
jgi:hypothetical protein